MSRPPEQLPPPMSAPPIPNLLSLRGTGTATGTGPSADRGRGSDFRRARGRDRFGGFSGTSEVHDADAVVQGTDVDAALSRLCAVEMGYLHDPFAQYFADAGPDPLTTRRLPIINRGTYTRTTALDRLIQLFLSDDSPGDAPPHAQPTKQIISLGAGTDTRSLRLLSQLQADQAPPPARHRCRRSRIIYHETDFPAICAKKLRTFQRTPALLAPFLPDSLRVEPDGSWHCSTPAGDELWCHGVDLRDLARSPRQHQRADDVLRRLDADVPTLLLSECCLCYLETADAGAVVARLLATLRAGAGVVLYEATRPADAFGRVMATNLAARGIRMPTLAAYPTPADQEARLRAAGLRQACARTVDHIWQSDGWTPPQEKDRVDALEGLDEVEEWDLLAAHYVVAWAWDGGGFEAWERAQL